MGLAKHQKLNLSEPFKPKPGGAKERRNALAAIKAIRRLKIPDPLKKRLLSRCIWVYTEADGKYNVRYCSVAAKLYAKRKLRHEHVEPRKTLIRDLMSSRKRAGRVLTKAIACIVTAAEHARLHRVNPKLRGWSRYKEAGIKVYDRKKGKRFI